MKNIFQFLIALSLIFVYKPVFSQTPVPYLKLNGKYIYVDSATMEPLISKEYDLAFSFYDSLAWVVVNNKFGLINTSGKEIFTPKYYRIRSLTKQSGYWGIEFKYELNNLRVRMEDKEKLIDGVRKEIFINAIPFNLSFYNGVACVADSLNKWALIDNKGNEITPFIYDDLKNTGYNFISFKKNNATGYLNFSGKKIFNNYNISKGFEQCGCGMACVVNNGKYGYIDTSGKLRIPYKYSYENGYFINDFLVREYFQNGNRRFLILNKNGKEIELSQYSWVQLSWDGHIKFKREIEFEGVLRSEWGLLNNVGIQLSSKTYQEIWPGGENYCPVRSFDDKFGIIDDEGNEIIPPIYNYISHKDYGFKCDYFPPDKSAKKRIFNFNDKGIELPKLDSSDIECVFRKNKKNTNELIYKFIKFSDPNHFSNPNHYGLIANNGVVILKPIYDYIGELRHGFAWVSKDNKWGVIDSLGNIVTPLNIEMEYKDDLNIPSTKTNEINSKYSIETSQRKNTFSFFKSGFSLVINNNKIYFINSKGVKTKPLDNIKIPDKYRLITYCDGYEINLPKESEWDFIVHDYENFENGFAWFKSSSNNYFLISDTGMEYREK